MMMKVKQMLLAAFCGMLLSVTAGCNSPAGMAVQLVGKAVDDYDTKKMGEDWIGKPASAANAKLGQPLDTWRQVGGSREWRVYPVSMDVLGNQRIMVQLTNGRIAAITKVKIDATGVDLARKMMYDQKVAGKSPRECEVALNVGPPVLTARSETTGLMAQLYDAKMIPGIGSPQYCRLKFDANQRCNEAALMDVSASTKDNPAQ